MIKFICNSIAININKIKKMNYHELLMEECYFAIIIDNKIFFEQPLFPIYEFIYFYAKWDKINNFKYITIESEDNPMISFFKARSGWRIDSVWKKFECNQVFTLLELTNSIDEMIEGTRNDSIPLKDL